MNTFEKGLLQFLSSSQLVKIQSVKIGIGGAGGLGSNIALMLVRSGFKNFEIIDSDKIEASNLNRQQYFLNDIGKNKVEILRNRLLDINPDVIVQIHQLRWNSINADTLFQSCDFIIEAFDKAANKKQFVESYQNKTKYIIGASGLAGIAPETNLNTRKIKNIFIVGDQTNEAGNGNPPMAPRVTECAAIMAQLVLKLALKS